MTRWRAVAAWLALLLLTTVSTWGLWRAHVPAALVLGPMASGILVALWHPGLRVPRGATTGAQAVLGVLIASALAPAWLEPLLPAWPALVGMNLLSTSVILGLGLGVARLRWMPGTTAIWGMSPGAASAMVMLSESHGADPQLVAVMQYLRLLAAALTAILIGTWFGRPAQDTLLAVPGAAGTPWWTPLSARPLAVAGALAAIGTLAALGLRRSSLALMVPVAAGLTWQLAGGGSIQVPPLASALAFATVGWHVGLGFTADSLRASARLLPRIAACIVAILVATAALAGLLAAAMDIDFLSAYLALNPGGMDAVLLVAAGLDVDLPLILAMQVARLIVVIALAPLLAGWATRWVRAARP